MRMVRVEEGEDREATMATSQLTYLHGVGTFAADGGAAPRGGMGVIGALIRMGGIGVIGVCDPIDGSS